MKTIETVKLNNGRIVLAKRYGKDNWLCAVHYTNRTQASKKQAELGEKWVVHHPGVSFYVALKQQDGDSC